MTGTNLGNFLFKIVTKIENIFEEEEHSAFRIVSAM